MSRRQSRLEQGREPESIGFEIVSHRSRCRTSTAEKRARLVDESQTI